MFRLNPNLAVYLHRDAIDFRKNINGLATLVEREPNTNLRRTHLHKPPMCLATAGATVSKYSAGAATGLVWGGPPRHLIVLALERKLRCATCPELVAEFQRVLRYPRIDKALRQRGLIAAELVSQFGLACDVVPAPPLPRPVGRDPDDDTVLACAVAASGDMIISGDADLLTLGHYQGIPILRAPQALARLDLAA